MQQPTSDKHASQNHASWTGLDTLYLIVELLFAAGVVASFFLNSPTSVRITILAASLAGAIFIPFIWLKVRRKEHA